MPAKKNAVTTPLHLLQQLSQSLVSHLEKACNEALKDAEMTLAKLEKQRGRTQEKIIKARAKLDDAGSAGKSKVQTKARAKLAELDDMLAVLQAPARPPAEPSLPPRVTPASRKTRLAKRRRR